MTDFVSLILCRLLNAWKVHDTFPDDAPMLEDLPYPSAPKRKHEELEAP